MGRQAEQGLRIDDLAAQLLQHTADAAGDVQVFHEMLAGRVHRGQLRRILAEDVEQFQRQLHPGLAGDGQQVQHGVGRTAQGQVDADGVLEGGPGHDVARA